MTSNEGTTRRRWQLANDSSEGSSVDARRAEQTLFRDQVMLFGVSVHLMATPRAHQVTRGAQELFRLGEEGLPWPFKYFQLTMSPIIQEHLLAKDISCQELLDACWRLRIARDEGLSSIVETVLACKHYETFVALMHREEHMQGGCGKRSDRQVDTHQGVQPGTSLANDRSTSSALGLGNADSAGVVFDRQRDPYAADGNIVTGWNLSRTDSGTSTTSGIDDASDPTKQPDLSSMAASEPPSLGDDPVQFTTPVQDVQRVVKPRSYQSRSPRDEGITPEDITDYAIFHKHAAVLGATVPNTSQAAFGPEQSRAVTGGWLDMSGDGPCPSMTSLNGSTSVAPHESSVRGNHRNACGSSRASRHGVAGAVERQTSVASMMDTMDSDVTMMSFSRSVGTSSALLSPAYKAEGSGARFDYIFEHADAFIDRDDDHYYSKMVEHYRNCCLSGFDSGEGADSDDGDDDEGSISSFDEYNDAGSEEHFREPDPSDPTDGGLPCMMNRYLLRGKHLPGGKSHRVMSGTPFPQ